MGIFSLEGTEGQIVITVTVIPVTPDSVTGMTIR